MSRYVNGVNIEDDENAIRIISENETMKYYPKFKNTPDPEKLDPADVVIYDGGTVNGW